MLTSMNKKEGIAALKKIEPEAIAAAKAVFSAMAFVETIKPVVEGYQRKILAEEKYAYDEKWHGRRGITYADWITEPEDSYLMADDDAQHYYQRCDEEMAKAGLRVEKKGNCPLLVAEHLLIQAKNLLIDVMEPVTGIKHEQLYRHGLKDYDNYIDLTLRWLAPKITITS